MTVLSDPRVDAVPVAEELRTDAVKARLEAEYALQLELLAQPRPVHEHQATSGQGETDHVNVATERHVATVLDAHVQQAIEEIEAALARIEDGTYGTCVRCAMPIEAERLAALPRVKYCIECQRSREAE
jgi:RNA polymerase-binding transcription factor DksA